MKNKKSDKLEKHLEVSKKSFFSKLNRAILGKSTIDNDVLDELEEVLISSDVGVNTTLKTENGNQRFPTIKR